MKRGDIIAVDLGGTNLRTALVRNNKILKYTKKLTPKNKKDLLNVLSNSISQFMSKNVKGIGISSPGPLENGVIKNSPNIALKNFNLRKYVKNRFNVPVEVENDANCVALAEAKLGVKKKNFFILTIGTGIGGGIIIHGELHNKGVSGGELGYLYLSKDKTFEDLTTKELVRMTKKSFGRKLRVIELLKINNPRSNKILNEVSENLGQGIGSLINIFNPEAVVLSGGVAESGEPFIRLIRKKTKKYIKIPGNFKIVWSKLKNPGILGAALLLK